MIICNSRWSGKERHAHTTVGEVRLCFEAARDEAKGIPVWECGWLLEGRYDDGSTYAYPCELPARYTDDRGSYACAGGHDFVPTQVRMEQGWDYAADEDEACLLRRYGTDAVAMNGSSI